MAGRSATRGTVRAGSAPRGTPTLAEDLTVTILRGHVVLRLRLVEREAGARRRRAERSGFVPGAGRMAAKVATAKVVEGVALALRAAIR